ncbi:hypothetical protein Sjap_002559 [Stephania japonica]|uniref:Uncharacterized protein n=1 Tax=Stephania japonica TaxID=461633 RepID=A0AAP0PUM7_9MAGN
MLRQDGVKRPFPFLGVESSGPDHHVSPILEPDPYNGPAGFVSFETFVEVSRSVSRGGILCRVPRLSVYASDEAVEGLGHSNPLNQSVRPDWSLVESKGQFGPCSTGLRWHPPWSSLEPPELDLTVRVDSAMPTVIHSPSLHRSRRPRLALPCFGASLALPPPLHLSLAVVRAATHWSPSCLRLSPPLGLSMAASFLYISCVVKSKLGF